jgi:hypothetical protein
MQAAHLAMAVSCQGRDALCIARGACCAEHGRLLIEPQEDKGAVDQVRPQLRQRQQRRPGLLACRHQALALAHRCHACTRVCPQRLHRCLICPAGCPGCKGSAGVPCRLRMPQEDLGST